MKHQIHLGTVSEATLREEDLIPTFLWEVKYYDPENQTMLDIENKLDEMDEDQEDQYWDSEEASLDCQDLIDELNNLCSDIPYVYFGTNEGDGADFGFWVDTFSIEENIKWDENLKAVSDLSELPDDYEGDVLVVNDHGNMTLYNVHDGKTSEYWSIV